MVFWQILADNLLGFDLLIFIAAGFNAVCYILARRRTLRLYRKLHMIIFVPSHRENPEALADAVRDLDEEEIVSLRKSSEAFYTIFANITSIFPLLGILGTVISLMPMVADMADMSRNFFAALTSTFWGLVFAIIFKLLDGFLVSRIEDNDKNVTLLLDRNVLTQKASLR